MRLLFAIVFISLFFIPKNGYSQVDLLDWMNDGPFEYVTKGMKSSKNTSTRGREIGKSSSRERAIERKEAERRRQVQNRIESMSYSEILSNIDDSECGYMIRNEYVEHVKRALNGSKNLLHHYNNDFLRNLIDGDANLLGEVKNDILSQKEKILDFAQDPHLNQLIMSDPYLRECYKEMQARQDIKRDSRTVLDYIKDPYLKQIIKEDPKLHEILGQEMAKKADEEIKRQKQREAEEQKLKELHDADEIAEIKRRENENQKEKTRIADEKNRANEQTIKNEGEIKKNKDLQDDLLSSPAFAPHIPDLSISIPDPLDLMVSDPTAFFGINYTDDRSEKGKDDPKVNNQQAQENYYDDNLKKKSYFEDVKDWWDANNYTCKINKTYEASKEKLSTMIKDTPDNARKRIKAIPIKIVNEKAKKNVDFIYGDGSYKTGKVIYKVRNEEVELIEGIIHSLSNYAVNAVFSGDDNQLNGSVNPQIDSFQDKQFSHIEELTNVKFRKFMRWLKNEPNTDENEY